jgi:uncharacterized protein YqgC (DUF456 family)
LIFKISILIILLIGQLCTLAPKLHGTLVILGTSFIYSLALGLQFSESQLRIFFLLLILTVVAEGGSSFFRVFLTRNYNVSRKYSVNTIVCNLAGIIVADALLGALVGAILWEYLVAKALIPRIKGIGKVLLRLALVALLRFICGIIMIIIICKYIIFL